MRSLRGMPAYQLVAQCRFIQGNPHSRVKIGHHQRGRHGDRFERVVRGVRRPITPQKMRTGLVTESRVQVANVRRVYPVTEVNEVGQER